MKDLKNKFSLSAHINPISILLLLVILVIISACNQTEAVAETAARKANSEAPAIGTDIKDVIQKPSSENTTGGVKEIKWDDLIPSDFSPDIIAQKYKQQVDNIAEGADENSDDMLALMDKIIAEFNNAPANKELDGVKVKIPGFIALLDEKDGMVNEFLLVPYFGSCIHSPPPPVNQTVLVMTRKGKSIPIEDIYEPVWVTGKVKVERKETELAQAGYVIQDAELERYEFEKVAPLTQ